MGLSGKFGCNPHPEQARGHLDIPLCLAARATVYRGLPGHRSGATGRGLVYSVDATATFPAEGLYGSIVLHLSLTCPQGGCDAWDRFASIGIVTQKGQNGAPDTEIEIARYITPYQLEGSWDIDVTDLRPLLSGSVTMRAFIDTWVGPGSPYGAGWEVTASFEMTGGIPAKEPVAVVPVWARAGVV